MNAADIAGRFGSGQAVRRIEDPALVQGQGRFTDDVAPQGQVFIRFVRSTPALTWPQRASSRGPRRAVSSAPTARR